MEFASEKNSQTSSSDSSSNEILIECISYSSSINDNQHQDLIQSSQNPTTSLINKGFQKLQNGENNQFQNNLQNSQKSQYVSSSMDHKFCETTFSFGTKVDITIKSNDENTFSFNPENHRNNSFTEENNSKKILESGINSISPTRDLDSGKMKRKLFSRIDEENRILKKKIVIFF